MRKPTIYEVLREQLGREPTNAELKAAVERVKNAAYCEVASRGKLPHQKRRRSGTSMGAIREPGKFEGEQDYSEHFFERAGGGFVDHEWYTPNGVVDVFDVIDDDVEEFPQLEGVKRVAFLNEEQGFYTEIDPPTDEDLMHSWPSDGDSDTMIVFWGSNDTYTVEGGELHGKRYHWLQEAARAVYDAQGEEEPIHYVDRKGGAHETDRDGRIRWSW